MGRIDVGYQNMTLNVMGIYTKLIPYAIKSLWRTKLDQISMCSRK